MKKSISIVVVDNGFVFVGETDERNGKLMISNCQNIRKWGTTKGLGELRNGPLKETVIDDYGTVIIPSSRVVFTMPVSWP